MRRARRIAAFLPVLAALAAAGGAGLLADDESARLLTVSSQVEESRAAVLLEASRPVAYLASRPDPFTVLLELRDVDASGAVNRVPVRADGPIAGVELEGATTPEGRTVARVRVSLTAPIAHRVRSARGTIHLELDRDEPVRPDHASTPALVPAGAAAGVQAPARATRLRSVRAAPDRDGFIVTLMGDGRLVPGFVGQAEDLPHRLVMDFPGVQSDVPASTEVGLGPIERIRVAPNSLAPLVTRVVLDLDEAVEYALLPSGDETGTLAVLLRSPSQARQVEPLEPVEQVGQVASLAPALPPQRPRNLPIPLDPIEALGLTPVGSGQWAVGSGQRPPPSAVPVTPSAERPAPSAQSPAPSPVQVPAQYTGHAVTLDFQQADLRAVLRTFAEISGLNLVIDPAVAGSVDVALREVPWDQALDIILRANRLGYSVDGTVVRIAPLATLRDEERQRRELAEEQRLSGDLRVLTRTLSYAQASAMAGLITQAALSQRGSVQVDDRTNTLIITDLQEYIGTVEELIERLDRPEPQVEIEARIVQMDSQFARQLGIQWGLTGRVAPDLGNTTPFAFPNQGGITGRTGLLNQSPDPRASDLESAATAVNLPASGATSAIGLALGAVNGAFNLDIALSALERTGKVRILSTPRVTTQNNIEAEMTQGVQIPVQTVANNTVTVTFQDAALTLRVQPQITAARTVIMRIQVENASPGEQVQGIPSINTQRALTQVQVSDGDTTVIGGVFVSEERTDEGRTPALHRVPLLGWLFRRESRDEQQRELLIFITPRIIGG